MGNLRAILLISLTAELAAFTARSYAHNTVGECEARLVTRVAGGNWALTGMESSIDGHILLQNLQNPALPLTEHVRNIVRFLMDHRELSAETKAALWFRLTKFHFAATLENIESTEIPGGPGEFIFTSPTGWVLAIQADGTLLKGLDSNAANFSGRKPYRIDRKILQEVTADY